MLLKIQKTITTHQKKATNRFIKNHIRDKSRTAKNPLRLKCKTMMTSFLVKHARFAIVFIRYSLSYLENDRFRYFSR